MFKKEKRSGRAKFGKEHYAVIAKAVSQLPAHPDKRDVIMGLTKALSENSPSFIAHRFMDACGE